MSNRNTSSDAGVFLWMTYQTMQKMGLDSAAIFASVHLPDQLPDKNVRRANSTQQRFWQAAEQISQDHYIGLHVGEHMPTFRGQVIEYLFLSSPTFGEGLARTIKYQAILSNALSLELVELEDVAIIRGLEHPVRHYLECAIGLLLNFFKHMSNQQFQAQKITLNSAGNDDPLEYQRVWDCPVEFNAEHGSIYFDKALLDLPSPAAEPELLKIHENIASHHLDILEKHQLIIQIEKILSRGALEKGQINQQQIAQLLGKHPRTLRQDLQLLNTTFDKIIANYREKLARRLLSQTHESLEQIVYLTGFSEPSAFSRAFKRWTGETPSAYRLRKQNKNEFD
ncbi:AraC family transcriptional regulator [Acinetobacter gerneri]|jgi:AraC-like DNA-binding protein|uniref:AraC family transcriptional regulator n=1 Tax=Acinetobacter gerneri TaxID=202952 RepID=UPI0023F30441|nr:AraC family transcriptional regulator [Acinetobacter gerneri]MCH4244191.1 AraC family transcriptional regulator [Acinetobacter gerneri]